MKSGSTRRGAAVTATLWSDRWRKLSRTCAAVTCRPRARPGITGSRWTRGSSRRNCRLAALPDPVQGENPMPDKYEHIQYEVEKDGLCTITFNRPELMNAFSWPMMEELREALRRAEKDTSAHVIILRGAGRCFSVGYDFRETPPDVIRPGVGPSDGTHDPRGVQ